MLVGTTAGGLLGQLDLRVPYVVRALLLVPIIMIAWTRIQDLGYEKRPLQLATLPKEMKTIFVAGVRHGLRHPVVRPLIFAAAVANTFMMFGFYSWQRYFLDLLGKELVWVNGLVAALVGAWDRGQPRDVARDDDDQDAHRRADRRCRRPHRHDHAGRNGHQLLGGRRSLPRE